MQATGGVRTKSGKPAGPPPDLVEVAFADEVPAEDGGRKAVDIPGSQQPLMLMRYKNKIIGTAAQCTRCKFPLVGADYADNALTWCVQIFLRSLFSLRLLSNPRCSGMLSLYFFFVLSLVCSR